MKLSDHDMAELSKVFAPVLEWLDVEVYKKNPKVGFNMDMYHSQIYALDFRGVKCKETVCIIGYIWKHNEFETHRDYGYVIIEDIIEKFNFDDIEKVKKVLNLVSYENDDIVAYIDLEKIKPYQAAAAIRYFLKTGKVKWNKFIDYGQISGG